MKTTIASEDHQITAYTISATASLGPYAHCNDIPHAIAASISARRLGLDGEIFPPPRVTMADCIMAQAILGWDGALRDEVAAYLPQGD